MVGISPGRASGATLAELRRETAADHESVDALIDLDRLVERAYYTAVLRGLIDAAELVEVTLPTIPHAIRRSGLSPREVSKRAAIDSESAFLDQLTGPRRVPHDGDPLPLPDSAVQGTMAGLLYVYVGSGLGGLHQLRVARNAPWWPPEREHLMLWPYGRHLAARWRSVLGVLERLNPDETNAAILAAHIGFDAHRRALLDHLSVAGQR